MGKRVDNVDLDDVRTAGWQRRRSDASAWQPDSEEIPLVEQSHKDSCDINVLMSRYEKNGIIPEGKNGQPFFGDFTNIPDFQSAQNMVAEATSAFMQLPAKVRSRFYNDPGKLLEFLNDEKNREEAITLGLVNRVAPAAVDPVKVDPAPAAPEPKKA